MAFLLLLLLLLLLLIRINLLSSVPFLYLFSTPPQGHHVGHQEGVTLTSPLLPPPPRGLPRPRGGGSGGGGRGLGGGGLFGRRGRGPPPRRGPPALGGGCGLRRGLRLFGGRRRLGLLVASLAAVLGVALSLLGCCC